MSYEYIDREGDRLRISFGSPLNTFCVTTESDGEAVTVYVEFADAPAVALELLKAAEQESVIVPKSTLEVVDAGLGAVRCGRDDEMAIAYLRQAPATLRTRAANFIALAEHIETKATREAAEKAEAEAAEKKLQERRDALAKKAGHPIYMYAPQNIKTLIAQVVELEDKLDGASRD